MIEELLQAVSNVGFPIACAVAMFVCMEKEREAHKEESEKWVAALNENTNVIKQFMEMFKHGEN